MRDLFKKIRFIYLIPLLYLTFTGCEPLVSEYDEVDDCDLYVSANNPEGEAKDTILVMTWNIRFGIARALWYIDCCGDRSVFTKEEVQNGLSNIVKKINELKPDILFIQEIDINCKRSGYIDEMQYIIDNTYFKYAAYASRLHDQYLPSDNLGRINTGNAVFSRWKLTAERIQLPDRTDYDALSSYFYMRSSFVKAKIQMPEHKSFYAIATHFEAFATDSTRKMQAEKLASELAKIDAISANWILGADFNMIPPGSDKVDFCMDDKCEGESYHNPGDKPFHKDGSNCEPDTSNLRILYTKYKPDITLDVYKQNQEKYFSYLPAHTQRNYVTDEWRKLDYLFTNYNWIEGTELTHQDCLMLSDHVPVTKKWEVPK